MKNTSKKHQFTVVIPTRERCDTLEHSLRTCVMQEYENLEIIVSDNFSQDRTREVVESYHDSRIRYINTGKRVSMTDNFEFALSHVKPEGYVIYIGDDDGLLPNAIRDINAVINETGAQVLRWEPATFIWPNAENSASQRLFVSLNSGILVRDSAATIQNILSFNNSNLLSFASLPMIYMRSAVDYKIIKKIMESSGKFYHSMTPDVYSGFVIAGSVKNFFDSKRPYGLVGSSRHSNGAGSMSHSLSAAALQFLHEKNLPFHPDLIYSCSIHLVVAEAFLQAQDHIPFPQKFTVNLEKMLFLMMNEAAPKAQELYLSAKDAVLQMGKMHNMPEAAQRAITDNPKREPGFDRKLTLRNIANAGIRVSGLFLSDIRKGSLYIDCSSLNVKNIYDASLLCYHILGLKAMNIFDFSAVLNSSLSNIKRIIALRK